MDDNTFVKWYMAIVEGIVESDSDSLVLPMDRSIDGIHYEVNSKGKIRGPITPFYIGILMELWITLCITYKILWIYPVKMWTAY